ncbi:MAG: tetratricopeptide repeat protein [Planctomycetota bacterium]
MRPIWWLVPIVLVSGGILAWNAVDSGPALAIDEDLAQQAALDGSGASEIRLAGEVDWQPRTLTAARALLGESEIRSAARRLNGYLAQHPEDGAAHVLLAECLRRQGDLDQAEIHATKGVELLPTMGRAHWVRSMVLRGRLASVAAQGGMAVMGAMGTIGPYRDALHTAIALDPENLEARKEEVLFYLVTPMIGDPAKGLELARAMEELHPVEGPLTVARALYFNGEKEAGVQKARELCGTFPDDPLPKWVLASLEYDAKRYDDADALLAEVLAMGLKDETYYQALYQRMRLRTERDLEPQQVLDFCAEYETADPKFEWAPPMYQVLCERGCALQDLGRFEEARAALEACLAAEPAFKRAKLTLAGLE